MGAVRLPTQLPAPGGRGAIARAEIVVTMVSDASAVLAIARDEGVPAALAPGAVWVQMSTTGVAGTAITFNLADIAIALGGLALVWAAWRPRRAPRGVRES